MKRFLLVLAAAAVLSMAPAVAGEMCNGPDSNHANHVHQVPQGDNISHVADDGSYRDNDRGVWVDACGREHPLCSDPVICPEVTDCEVCPDCIECPTPAPCTREHLEFDDAMFLSTYEPSTRLQEWSVQPVIGGKNFLGIQGRYRYIGARIGRIDMSRSLPPQSTSSQAAQPMSFTSDSSFYSESGSDCTQICHKPGTSAEHTICPNNQGVINGHLGHGDNLGECESDDPEDPYCGDGNLDEGEDCETCPADAGECNDDPECGDGVVDPGETCSNCPEDVGECKGPDDDPEDPKDLGWQRTDDDALSLEVFVYVPELFRQGKNCYKEDGKVKTMCRLNAYVGGGAIRVEEDRIVRQSDGSIESTDSRIDWEPTATVGAEYIFPFKLTVGAAWHSEAKYLINAGYGHTWPKDKAQRRK